MAADVPDPVVMGIVNVTPDSFSDGGLTLDPGVAIAHGLALVEQGAQVVDVGGESTRPGAQPVSEREELRRVLPVLEGLRGSGARLSIDTSKAAVAAAALDAGASLVNDVTALRGDPGMAALVAERGCGVCLMHMLGEPRTMQRDPRYGDVVADVRAFLAERLQHAIGAGIAEQRVWLDPGIGFGKTIDHNLALLNRLDEIVSLGRPVVVGTSRKSFLGTITGGRAPGERIAATLATNVIALTRGARVFRVHDVAEAHDALLVAAATLRGRWTPPTTTSTTTTASTTSSTTTKTPSRPS
jgi:dihydropteroate synthase